MQPEKGKRRKIQSGVSRARMMFKQNMEWVPGFVFFPKSEATNPEAAHWIYLGNDRTLKEKQIFREDIRAADSTVKKLVLRFPRALPAIVADVGQWQARMDFFLGLCKSWVHEQQTPTLELVTESDVLPARWVSRLNQLRRKYPQLETLLTAFGFLELTSLEKTSPDSLEWFELNANALSEFATADHLDLKQILAIQISMWRASEAMPIGLLSKLSTMLARPNAFRSPSADRFYKTDEYREKIEKRISKKFRHSRPLGSLTPRAEDGEQLGKIMLDFFAKTFELKSKEQANILQVLNLLLPAGFAHAVSDHQEGLDDIEKRWLRLLNQHEGQAPLPLSFSDDLEGLRTRTEEFAKETKPVSETISQFVSSLAALSGNVVSSKDKDIDWCAILSQIPEELRVSRFYSWSEYLRYSSDRHQDLRFTLGQLANLLKRHKPSATLERHWKALASRRDDDFISETCDRFQDDRRIQSQTILLLERVLFKRPVPISDDLLCSISSFAAGASSLDEAEQLIGLLEAETDLDVQDDELVLAKQFSNSIPQCCDLLKVISAEYEYRQALEELVSLAPNPMLRAAVVRSVLDRELATLEQLRWVTLVLKSFDSIEQCLEQIGLNPKSESRDSGSENDSWISGYPIEFRPTLKRLAEIACAPKKVATQILGKDVPDRSALRTEIDAIESKLNRVCSRESGIAVKLAKRVENLKSYLQFPPKISPKRISNLTMKLESRIQHEAIARFISLGREVVKANFRETPNAEGVLDTLQSAKFGGLLAEILNLNSKNQKLGLRLLFETEAGSTSCFDADPQNLAFLDSIQSKGIDTDPWTSAESWEEETKDCRSYTLAFTDEVIDFLLMGFHFNTCLSPGHENFFSTIANAVDINKKVLYGKTPDGKIVGRCLFVLNSRGQILTFRRYQHDVSSQFSEAVDRYAKVLAEKMGTVLASEGSIPNLVAPEWYNDGPQSGEPGFFSSSGTVDRAIEAAPSGKKLAALLELVSKAEILDRHKEVLYLAEHSNSKEFQQDLLDEFKTESELTLRHRVSFASFAFSQDFKNFIPAFMGGEKLKPVIRFLNQDYCCEDCSQFKNCGSYQNVFGMLIELNPTFGLRAIRGTRPSEIKEDEKDDNQARRRVLAAAHRKLGRVALADKLVPPEQNSQ